MNNILFRQNKLADVYGCRRIVFYKIVFYFEEEGRILLTLCAEKMSRDSSGRPAHSCFRVASIRC